MVLLGGNANLDNGRARACSANNRCRMEVVRLFESRLS